MSAGVDNSAPSLARTGPRLARCWNDFFHQPTDTRICAAIRIAFSLLVLINLAVLYPDLDWWFTDKGVLKADASREIASPYDWSVLWWLPSTPVVVHTAFWIVAIHALMLLVGVFSRYSALLVFIGLLSFQNRNTLILDSEDHVFRIIALLLALMPCGHLWSVDALFWRQRRRKDAVDEAASSTLRAAWALRVLQIQMCLIFLSAGLWKLSGHDWLDGTALYYVSRLEDYFGRFPIPEFLFETPWLVALLGWLVIAVELTVPALIWFRESRRWCLLAALLFHLANEWTMHLFLFHWIMLVGWMSFLQPADFAWLSRLLARKQRL